MGVVTPTHAGETAYGSADQGKPAAGGGPLARRLLAAFSHPRPVEASPPGARAPAAVPMGPAAPGTGPARTHLGLRRLRPRALRDRPRLRRRLPAQTPPARQDRVRLPEGAGPAADARPSRPGRRGAAARAGGAGRPLARRGLRAAGLRRHAPGVPSRGPVGAAPGPGRPVGGGPHAVADGPGAFTAGGAVGLALGPGHGQRARPPAADAAGAAVALPRRGGVLLAAVQEEGRIAVGAAARAADPGAGAAGPTRRVAGDQRAGPGPAVGGAGGPVLPLAVGERGAVPDVQADAGQDEVAQPDRAAGASGGRGLAAGDAAAFGARGAGGGAGGRGVQPAARAAGGPGGVAGAAAAARGVLRPAAVGGAAGGAPAGQRQGATGLAAADAAQAAQTAAAPHAGGGRKSPDFAARNRGRMKGFVIGIAWRTLADLPPTTHENETARPAHGS